MVTRDINTPHTPTSSSSHHLIPCLRGLMDMCRNPSAAAQTWITEHHSNISSEDTHGQTKINTSVQYLCLRVLPDGVFFQQPLHRDGQLPQEALDDWPTLGKLILHLDLQDVSGQGHKVKPLKKQTDREERIPLRRSTHSGTTVSVDEDDDYRLQQQRIRKIADQRQKNPNLNSEEKKEVHVGHLLNFQFHTVYKVSPKSTTHYTVVFFHKMNESPNNQTVFQGLLHTWITDK